jgi:hypothetical protein
MNHISDSLHQARPDVINVGFRSLEKTNSLSDILAVTIFQHINKNVTSLGNKFTVLRLIKSGMIKWRHFSPQNERKYFAG